MPRHPSVPDHLGWICLGRVTAEAAQLAIVGPEMAGLLSDMWMGYYLGEDGQPRNPPPDDPSPTGEIELGGEGDLAVLADVFADGTYIVEGRMADVGDSVELREIRIRLWACECTCHGDEDPAEHLCEGNCHDADPQ